MEIVYAPIGLCPHFPISGGHPFIQGDDPIRNLHYHECLELGYCYEGGGIFMIGEKVLPFGAGDSVLINRSEVHLAQSIPGTTSRWCWIYLEPPSLLAPWDIPPGHTHHAALAGPDFGNILHEHEDPELGRCIAKMADELMAKAAGHEACLRALTVEFFTRLGRLERVSCLAGNGGRRPSELDRIAPALQIIARDYAKPLQIPDVAKACNLSEPSLRRLFQQTVGRSPRDYWLDLRLRMAASMLRSTSRGVLQISQDVGFPTLSSFNRLFKARYGVSPSGWRRGRKKVSGKYNFHF